MSIERGWEWGRTGRPPLVEVHWQDCETEAGWNELRDAAHMQPRDCVQAGYLLSWDKHVLRMVGGFSLSDQGEVSEVCEATAIPGSWVKVVREVGCA